MLNLEHIITLGTVVLMIIALFREWHRPVVIFAVAAAIFLLTGIIDSGQFLSGFANEQVAVIILLLAISSVIQKARLLELWLNNVFRTATTYGKFSKRMMLFTAGVSGFLNNTPIVAAFIPYVFSWARNKGISPSKLLMPLSFAAILGGTMTLIGTSTNLIVNGLAQEYGFKGFELFDFMWIGLPLVILGLIYMLFTGNKLLPAGQDALEDVQSSTKQYLVETTVPASSPLVDKTVEQADLRNLKGLYLVEIIRGERIIGPVKPTQNIRAGDSLIFAGDTATIPDVLNDNIGLELPKLRDIPQQELIELVEAVVSYNSSLAGKRVRDTNFRGVYDAAIVGVHRNGERLSGKIGDIELQNGDLLVLMTGKDFKKRLDDRAFYLLPTVKKITNINKKKAYAITLGAIAAVLLAALKVMSLFKLLLLYLALSILFKWQKPGDFQKGLDLNLAFIAALSLAIGQAMDSSGTAQLVANGMVHLFGGFGTVGMLVGIYLLTNILTEFVTNVAAATLTLPIAISLASGIGVDMEPFVFTVAFAASASFLTPIGYQTNLMVYGPGAYKFKDFFRFGLPLSVLCLLVVVSLLVIRYELY